jgi:hypothetical protein
MKMPLTPPEERLNQWWPVSRSKLAAKPPYGPRTLVRHPAQVSALRPDIPATAFATEASAATISPPLRPSPSFPRGPEQNQVPWSPWSSRDVRGLRRRGARWPRRCLTHRQGAW